MSSGSVKNQPCWNVISEGRLYPGVQMAKIKPGLCSSLDIDEARAQQIIDGERQQLASFATKDEAENTILKLQVLGLVVSLEHDDGSGLPKRSRVQRQQQEKRAKRWHWWLLTPVTLALFVLAYTYQLVPDIPPAGTGQVAKAHSDNIQHGASLQLLQPADVKVLLEHSDYAQLHSQLSIMQRNFSGDAQWEFPLIQLLESIAPANGITKLQLDNWVASHNSAFSYLARGYYLLNQLKSSAALSSNALDLAHADLLQAQKLDPNLLPAYSALIALSNWRDDINALAMLQQAVNIFPTGYSFWHEYALLKLPSWHAHLWFEPDFLQDLETQLKFNRRLSAIRAYRLADYARLAKQAGHAGLCLRFYNKAFEYGYQRQWLINRAECALSAKQHHAAKTDLQLAQALQSSPYVSSLLARAKGGLVAN